MHRPTIAGLAVVAALLLAGCEDDPTEPTLAGQYALVSVGGRPLPAAVDSVVTDEGRTRQRITGRFLLQTLRVGDEADQAWALSYVQDGLVLNGCTPAL